MGLRNIVKIDEEKCNGCGLCVPKCMEGAIQIIDGKARLIGDKLCDGLGNCLGHCPQDAIEIVEREAEEYDEEAVDKNLKNETLPTKKVIPEPIPCNTGNKQQGGCPGSKAKLLEKKNPNDTVNTSELTQWPVQLKLISSNAPYFKGADILVAADCTAYAYANFHKEFIKGRITLIGCPKLDDVGYYTEKLTEIFKNEIKSIIVVRMSVPCCEGLVSAVKSAILASGNIVNYKEVTIGIDGEILD